MSYKVTEEEKNRVKMNSPFTLPDSPTERGMKPDNIKAAFWKAFNVLIEILNKHLEDIFEAEKTHDQSSDAHTNIRELITEHNKSELSHSDIRELITSLVGKHNESELSHSDIRELVLEARNKAHGAFDLASGKSKVHVIKSFMQIFTLHAMDTSVFREGDLLVCVDKNVPDAVVARLDKYAVSECDALFSSTDLENGNVSIEPRAGETYVMSYWEGQTTMYFSVTCIESGIDVEEIVKKAVDSIAVDTELSDTSTNPVQNKVITERIIALENDKQDKLVLDELPTENSANFVNSGGIAAEFKNFSTGYDQYIDNMLDQFEQEMDKKHVLKEEFNSLSTEFSEILAGLHTYAETLKGGDA